MEGQVLVFGDELGSEEGGGDGRELLLSYNLPSPPTIRIVQGVSGVPRACQASARRTRCLSPSPNNPFKKGG